VINLKPELDLAQSYVAGCVRGEFKDSSKHPLKILTTLFRSK